LSEKKSARKRGLSTAKREKTQQSFLKVLVQTVEQEIKTGTEQEKSHVRRRREGKDGELMPEKYLMKKLSAEISRTGEISNNPLGVNKRQRRQITKYNEIVVSPK